MRIGTNDFLKDEGVCNVYIHINFLKLFPKDVILGVMFFFCDYSSDLFIITFIVRKNSKSEIKNNKYY